MLSIIKAFFAESFVEAYAHIKVPVLLIHATEPKELDATREKGIEKMKEFIEDVTIISVEAGHMIQWDEPEKVAEEMIAFVQRFEQMEKYD